MLLRTKFRYLFGGLMVVGLLWGGLSAYGSLGPTSVPVLYEPYPPVSDGPPLEMPDEDDYQIPAELPRVPTYPPKPKAPVYSSGWYQGEWYGMEKSVPAWRWYQSAMCYRWNLTQDSQGNWTVEQLTGLTCQEVADYYSRPGKDFSLAKAIEYFSWFAADDENKTKVAKAGNADPQDIPTFDCDYKDLGPDGENGFIVEEAGTCELHPTWDDARLLELGVDDADERARLVQFVADYATTATVDVVDRDRMRSDYEADVTAWEAEKKSILDAYQAEYDAVKNATVLDEDAYDAAMVLYDRQQSADSDYTDAWDAYQTAYQNASGMFVDCRLTGCVVVNPVIEPN